MWAFLLHKDVGRPEGGGVAVLFSLFQVIVGKGTML